MSGLFRANVILWLMTSSTATLMNFMGRGQNGNAYLTYCKKKNIEACPYTCAKAGWHRCSKTATKSIATGARLVDTSVTMDSVESLASCIGFQ